MPRCCCDPFRERLVREASLEHAATLWAATKVLMGLRYRKRGGRFTSGVSAMILGIHGIEESSVYQDIFAQGEAKGEGRRARAKRGACRGAGGHRRGPTDIAAPGTKKFGPVSDAVETRIAALDDLDLLNDLLDRILDVSTWNELLLLNMRSR